ncbi:zinc finger protein 532 isoform X2 [Ambystoma mexicanum]|uniref:zinc finger protein 532 isoform X2 n=1 Tax=Ambystoma mexicanum TaxID=8296 RepID=UPI0037E781C8
MGDMKTPDFDDLLAAFDIPDMVDPKAAIESGHDDHENHIKTHPHTDEDSHVPSSSDVGVSVIVKNIRIDTEGVEKDVHHMTSNGLHNGFLTVSNLERFNREGILTMKDLGTASEGTLKNSVFNQFSPISSAEEFEDDEKIEVVDPPDKDDMRSGYRASMLTRSFTQQEYDRLKALGRETLNKSGFSYSMHNSTVNGPETNCVDVSICEPFKVGQLEDNLFNDSVKPLEKMTLKETSAEKSETDSTCGTQFNCKAKPSLKLSSCIAAIQALNARKVSPDRRKNSQSNSAGSSPLPKERIESPVPIEQSSESVSLIDGANKLLVKQPDSPRSVSSETSSKGSPSSPAGSTPAIPKKTCSICQMLLPNPCSFSSHQRIHQHKSPYTCPECGAICRSAHFQTHVTKNCLHYTRRIGFRCLHCNVIYSEVASLKAHIQGAHCEVFYKCPICPMAFKSAPSTHSHVYTQHPGVKIGEPKTIYKCSMCETVFTLQTLLYRHFDQHIENQKVSVFKCPDCALLYAQKQLMMDHIKTMHGTLKSVEGPPNLGINLPISTKPSLQNSTSHTKDDAKPAHGIEHLEKKPMPVIKSAVVRKGNTGWTCWDCDELFLHRDAYITHMKKDHGKQMKKHPCRQCEKSFSSSHSLCRHNRIKHKGIRKVYNRLPRPAVNGSFMKQSILEKQIEVTEDVKEPEFEEVAELTEASENTTLDESVEKEDTQGSTPKRKLEEPVEEFSPTKGAVSQPLKKLKINVFKVHKCAVCGFTTENLLQFHEHIPQHKSNGSSYQCRECGLCYTSHVSLSRHLFIIHKLKEPQPVSKQNGSGEENHHESKSGPEDELSDFMETDKRCKVCGKTFETETALNTHMRTHGMAFIKSKRMNCVEK